jgi:hypothetical protein
MYIYMNQILPATFYIVAIFVDVLDRHYRNIVLYIHIHICPDTNTKISVSDLPQLYALRIVGLSNLGK